MASLDQLMEFLEELKVEMAGLQAAIEGEIVVDASQINISSLSELVSGEAGIPTGGRAIVMFNVSCPAGWTRVTALDSKFIRGATTYGGTGGADTHTHTGVASHQHGAVGSHAHSYTAPTGSYAAAAGSQVLPSSTVGTTTGDAGAHQHAAAGSGVSTSSNVPAYVSVIFCVKD